MEKKVNILNKRARFEYEFIDTYTAGVVLSGVEVKFIRKGQLSFADSYCIFQNSELFMKNVSISGIGNDNIKRDRKILLKRRELNKIEKGLDKGLTIIPSRLYENEKGRFKVEIVVARGKKVYNKKETIKNRDINKEINRNLSTIKV
jgi:SsrA-binding protein